jgi:putative sporulation protein YtxC
MDKLGCLQKEGFPLNIGVDKIGEFTFMDCRLQERQGKNNKEAFDLIKNSIASCLADIIVEEWEARIIRRIVRVNYFYYNDEEKQAILNKAREVLNPGGYDSFQIRQRKEKVMEKILGYFEIHKDLILEGFINFRLKEYQNELEEIVNSAVDEFMLEKEYMEFIRLLKYFVEIQEPRVDKIKIIFKKNGKFMMLDAHDRPFIHECLNGLMVDLLENDINYDDLLISALITLAPRKVELHLEEGVEPGDTIRTILNVFGRKATQCGGCRHCRPDWEE